MSMLNFGIVVDCNNLIALKAFNTFLFNYKNFEHPSWIEKKVIVYVHGWLEREAIKTFKDLTKELGDVNIALNDINTSMFTWLYLAKHPELMSSITDGKELFLMAANTELEFEKLKKPKASESYK